ncbi:Hypothetical protein NTJ_14043 [Nesidiocoris tenuis]|uniref:Uncharacterized protein n=1 Tax=Nesidiocoris tenuis TaxID=355587 RepID=A0ABN7BA30_9HEMI|nr:Hypothetical protein NTJ_14043 [Nesidiocoris tenuis]
MRPPGGTQLRDDDESRRCKKGSAASGGARAVIDMLSQRVEELRRERMLQNYNESFTELRYSQLHMPPPAEYNSLVQHVEQPWYNSYSHGENHNGGSDYFSRGSESKTPSSDWNSYPSDTDSPFITPQMNNSCGLDRISPQEVVKSYDPSLNSDVLKHGRSSMSPYDGQYANSQMGPMLSQQMQMANHQMISSTPDSLMINEVNGLLSNGVDSAPHHTDQTSSTPKLKEEEMLPKLDLSISCQSANGSLSCAPRPMEKDALTNGTGGKDAMKLPGFHQTFGNITEIGRFSQHDDYFEVRPLPPEILDATPKLPEQSEPAPKRKARGGGRKRKTPESRAPPGGYMSPEEPPPPPAPCLPPEPHLPPPPPHQWQYPPHHMDPHPHHYPHHHHHNQWRNGPHPYNSYHHHHHHQSHYHYNPYNSYPPHHYNDCAPTPHHYNSYNSYPPPPPHQSAWHANSRDYNNVANYPGYV